MMDARSLILFSALLGSSLSFVDELDDTFLETRNEDDVWIIKFYAPWCPLCEQLDPVFRDVASELKSLGSEVSVGQSDATANTALSREFRVRGYPTILMWKKNMKYLYSGAKTRDGIMDFTLRVSGPTVRPLLSRQSFTQTRNRHDVMFVYVGVTSPLRGKFRSVAEELMVHTHFFSAQREALPEDVSVSSLPAVLLFKDGTYEAYTEEGDGDLRSWVNRERFPLFAKIDSFTLYAMGETGKLVALVLVGDRGVSEDSKRCRQLLEEVAAQQRHLYRKSFYFGVMEQSDYIRGLMMSDVMVPSFVVVNLTNDGYFLPDGAVEVELQLRNFLDGVLDNSVPCQGGNGIVQRTRRLIYEANITLTMLLSEAPLFCCVLFCFLFAVVAFFSCLCCKLRPRDDGDDDDVTTAAAAPLPRRHGHVANKKSD